jgi:tetratricopeptide (TPR) repeat protein
LLQQASVYFNREQFDKALPLLDRAVKEDSSSQLALFYRGVATWHTGAAVAALKDLEQVYKSGSLLQYEAAFYMALIYAGEKDKAAALDWLKKIPEDAPVAEKAAALRAQIK